MAILRTGSSGTEVKQAQENLKALGFYKGTIDGIFGENTKAAVIAFQKGKGLTADGEIGSKTGGYLLSGC